MYLFGTKFVDRSGGSSIASLIKLSSVQLGDILGGLGSAGRLRAVGWCGDLGNVLHVHLSDVFDWFGRSFKFRDHVARAATAAVDVIVVVVQGGDVGLGDATVGVGLGHVGRWSAFSFNI